MTAFIIKTIYSFFTPFVTIYSFFFCSLFQGGGGEDILDSQKFFLCSSIHPIFFEIKLSLIYFICLYTTFVITMGNIISKPMFPLSIEEELTDEEIQSLTYIGFTMDEVHELSDITNTYKGC